MPASGAQKVKGLAKQGRLPGGEDGGQVWKKRRKHVELTASREPVRVQRASRFTPDVSCASGSWLLEAPRKCNVLPLVNPKAELPSCLDVCPQGQLGSTFILAG